MNNNYEVPEVLELGCAQSLILGMKVQAITCDAPLGCGWRTTISDLDESDE